jgi:hypothetical protein
MLEQLLAELGTKYPHRYAVTGAVVTNRLTGRAAIHRAPAMKDTAAARTAALRPPWLSRHSCAAVTRARLCLREREKTPAVCMCRRGV